MSADPPHPVAGEAAIAAMLHLFVDLVLQLDARFDALRTVVCELHPELADRLEALIQQNTRANTSEVEKRQKMMELFQSVVSTKVQ